MSACTAKLELDGTNWGDCMVSVEWAQPKERASLTRAYIGAAGSEGVCGGDCMSVNVVPFFPRYVHCPMQLPVELIMEIVIF